MKPAESDIRVRQHEIIPTLMAQEKYVFICTLQYPGKNRCEKRQTSKQDQTNG